MYALTLWRPWSDAIVSGPKRVENRPWWRKTALGQTIAFHAGKVYDTEGADYCAASGFVCPPPARSPQGIVGTARVVGCVQLVRGGLVLEAESRPLDFDAWFGPQRAWLFGPYGWLFEDVRALPEPIACKGAQGLWRVSDDIVAKLAA